MDIQIKRCFVWSDIRREAGSLQQELAKSLGVTPTIKWGGFGQLDVVVDGKLVFSKKQVGRSPTAAEIVRAVRPSWPFVPMQTAITVVVAVLMLVGIVGAVVPGIPGTPLILAGAVVYAFATDWQPIGVGRLLILAALVVLAEVSGYAAVALGAKRSGGSRWAVTGAIVGTIVGLAFAPLGLVLGPFAGAIAGEALRTGSLRDSVRPGIGAAVGVLAGAVMQVAVALVMVGLFVWWAAFAS